MLQTVVNYHVWNKGLQNQTEKVPCTLLLNDLHTFVLNIFSVFNTLYLYINIGNWQVLFITQEQLGKSQSAISTFKCQGSTTAVLVYIVIISWERLKRSICQGHCVYFTTLVATIHYNKQFVVDSRKIEKYVYLRKPIVALFPFRGTQICSRELVAIIFI